MTQKLYFLATDKVGNEDLWVTDGTTMTAVGGLGDVGVANEGTGGLGPAYLTAFGQDMIFGGQDSLNDAASNGLWTTDGTAGGTTEVGGPSPGIGQSPPFMTGNPEGLNPSGFVSFGTSKAIFFGLDAAGFTGLWSTDGTDAGTVELGGSKNGQIAGKGSSLTPQNLSAFNNSVLFDGIDATGYDGLWITDGSTAGTYELGGTQSQAIFDSGLSNFEANNFITLGGLELFNAPNKSGNESVWVTDGTSADTYELGGIDNAQIPGANNTDLGDGLANAVQFGARVFFSGSDTGGDDGLWVTDGTSLGTVEVGGLGDQGLTPFQHPSAQGLSPTDLTVSGQKVLFNGADALGLQELWVSDGTSLGTAEIGGEGVGGDLTNEAINGVNPTSIVSLDNGKSVFIGYDKSNGQNSGKPTLWVTDGTYAGTSEIGGLDNQGVSNIYSLGFDLTSQIVGGSGLAYFTGEDKAGNLVLWETDGTVGGTKVVPDSDGLAPATGLDPQTFALSAVPAAADDFSGGGKSINLDAVPGEAVDLSNTGNVFDTVTGSNGLVNLLSSAANIIGGGVAVVMTGAGVAVGLYNTAGNKDTITGNKGTVSLNGAQANVIGVKNTITFANGTTGDVVYLSNTQNLWDSVTGSNGTVYLTSAQASVTGGGDTIDFAGGVNDAISLYGTSGNWDTVNATGGTIILNDAQASIVGGANAITETAGSSASLYNTKGNWDTVTATNAYVALNGTQASVLGGGNTIDETAGSTVSLYATNNAWDQVNASQAYVLLTSAQANITGGGDYVTANAGSQVSLTGTSGNWDTFTGSSDTIILNNAQASIVGGADTIYESGATAAASLYNTNGAWDSVYGKSVFVTLNSAQAQVSGGGDYISATGASSIGVVSTGGVWDTITGSGDTDYITAAQSSIVGGSDVVWMSGAASVSLYQTAGNWDVVNGSGEVVLLNGAQASIVGGSNQISATAGSSMSLYSTGANADSVTGSSLGVTLVNSQASLSGSGDSVSFSGSSALAASGGSEAFYFGQALGLSLLSGFQSSDVLHLSALDWTSYSALQGSHDLSEISGNAVITLGANDKLTLVGVQASSLTAANFQFA